MKYSIKKNIKKIIILLFRIFAPIKNDRVVLSGFNGSYSDNPKYICEKIHEINSNIKLFWVLGSKKHSATSDMPDYVFPLYTNKLSYYWMVNTAKVLVDNYYGFFLSDYPNVLDKMMKNNKQYNISTWHGTPIKRIGADIIGNNSAFHCFSSTDIMIAGCEYTRECLYSAYISHLPNKVDILLTGTPRNDILFNLSIDKKSELKRKLGIDPSQNVVLYAPTFRDSLEDSGITQMQMIDVDILLDTLHYRFGGEWVFVFRVHHEVEKMIVKYVNCVERRIINGNLHPDMAEYLSIADSLITDYSSSLVDYAITGRPCFLFAHDLDHYSTEERGMYMDMSDLPYDFSNSFEGLLDQIRDYNIDTQKRRIIEFQKKIGNVEEGDASLKIAKIILGVLGGSKRE